MDFREETQNYFSKLSATLEQLDKDAINASMNAIFDAYQRGANIYIFGNGGSAATASHFVCDFNKGISLEAKKKFNLICLNDNIPMMTAIANDIGYEDVYSMQLDGHITKDDLVIAISGSGNSANVIKAVNFAKEKGAKIVGITGYDGGKLKKLADFSMHVNIDDMQIVEDIHMSFDHMMFKVFCNYTDKVK